MGLAKKEGVVWMENGVKRPTNPRKVTMRRRQTAYTLEYGFPHAAILKGSRNTEKMRTFGGYNASQNGFKTSIDCTHDDSDCIS